MPTQVSIQLTEAQQRQIADLSAKGFGNRTDVIRLAIDCMWQQEERASMDKLEHLAEGIYIACFGHLDDKRLRATKTQEILDWLTDGSLKGDETVESLANEWREYDAEDPDIK